MHFYVPARAIFERGVIGIRIYVMSEISGAGFVLIFVYTEMPVNGGWNFNIMRRL